MNKIIPIASVLLAALAIACTTTTIPVKQDPANSGKVEGKEDAWSSSDSPNLFGTGQVLKFASLPLSGAAATPPWAGSYWPVYKDSINYKWNGANTDSPTKKYEKVFGGTDLEKKVSENHGILSHTSRTACTSTSDCDSSKGEQCAKRDGEDNGYCIPTWWGICHAWAPVAILEQEPRYPVTRNGVTFKVNDIKALLTLTYNRTYSKFVSLRCNTDASGDDMEYDGYNRPRSNNCRDTNPGTYHVILANFLGLRQQAFVEDRTWDDEVWNQPVRAFRVTHHQEVDAVKANELVGVTSSGGTVEEFTGTVAKSEWKHFGPFDVTAGSHVKALMTGSNDADLYLRFGAQPTASAYDCRPYAGSTAETCDSTAPSGASQVFISINGYADSSDFQLKVTYGGATPSSYEFNANAAKFIHIKSEVDYISESAISTDGNLADTIDSYTHTDHYEYVLEIDAQGDIIGGEWIGASKRDHPDFLWLPTGRRNDSVAGGGITYNNVKSLLLESISDPNGGGNNTGDVKTVEHSGTVAKDAWKHYGPFNIASGTALSATLTGTGDADLYVKAGAQPTKSSYDCRPYKGDSNETCNVTGSGPIYISINGYAASSNFNLKVTYTEDDGSGNNNGGNNTGGAQTFTDSGAIAKDAWKHFGPFEISDNTLLKAVMTGSGDADLYVRKGAQPTTSAYDCRPYESNTNETCEVTGTGPVYVSIRGYGATSNYSLIVTYTGSGGGTNNNGGTTTISHLNESGHVNQGQSLGFTVDVTAGSQIVVRSQAASDIDLYVKFGSPPTTSAYDARAYTYSGNETITYVPQATGTLHIMIYGYEASDFTLTTAAQ